MEAEIYIIPQFSNFVKSFLKNFSKNIFPKSIDKRSGMWYNIRLRQKSDRIFQAKNFLRNFQKSIDILIIIWYNNNVQGARETNCTCNSGTRRWANQVARGENPPCKARKNFLKTFKKPLDKIPKVWYNKSTEENKTL